MIKNILWIDDMASDSLIDWAYKKHAMIVVPKENVDDGIEELLNPSVSYDAIILDANCLKHRHETEEEKKANTSVSALTYALKSITENKIDLPWFVYSAGDFEGENSIKIVVEGYERVYDDKPYYNKPSEMKLLLNKIEEVVEDMSLFKMKSKYSDICDFFSGNDLIKLMIAYNEDEAIFSRDPNIPFQIRIMLERTCDFLYRAGVIFFDIKGSDISRCSQFIGKNGKNVPVYVQRAFFSAVTYANPGSHFNKVIKNVIENGTAPYLNAQAYFELMTILKWCSSLKMTEEEIANRLRISQRCARDNNFKVFYYEGIVEKDDLGNIHCGRNYMFDLKTIPTAEKLVGQRIGVGSYDDNTDERTQKIYKCTILKYSII